VAEEQVPSCLGGPRSGRVGGDTGEEHLPRGDVDEKQDVVAAERGGVDGEEVAGHGGLGVEELRPGDLGSLRRRIDATGFEDSPDGGGGDMVAEAGQFAVDASVAPGRVLGGEAENESADLDRRRWASRSSRGMCPVTGDAASMPSEQGVGRDDPACSSWAGERGGDGAEQGPVAVVDRWSVDLAAKDRNLVSQHDDLELLRTTRADRETGEHGDEAVENAEHSSLSSAAFPLISAHDRIFGPHRLSRGVR